MRQVRPSRGWWGMVALAGLWACETARNPSGSTFDLIPPVIQLTASADTQPIASGLQFTVTASDNLSLKDIQLTYSGGYIAQTDTVFTQTAAPARATTATGWTSYGRRSITSKSSPST